MQKRNKEALEIFLINYKKYPKDYVTNLGLARGYSANGDYSNALKYAKSGLALDPNPSSFSHPCDSPRARHRSIRRKPGNRCCLIKC